MDIMIENLKQTIMQLQRNQGDIDMYERALKDVMLHTHGSTAHVIAKNALIQAGVIERVEACS